MLILEQKFCILGPTIFKIQNRTDIIIDTILEFFSNFPYKTPNYCFTSLESPSSTLACTNGKKPVCFGLYIMFSVYFASFTKKTWHSGKLPYLVCVFQRKPAKPPCRHAHWAPPPPPRGKGKYVYLGYVLHKTL